MAGVLVGRAEKWPPNGPILDKSFDSFAQNGGRKLQTETVMGTVMRRETKVTRRGAFYAKRLEFAVSRGEQIREEIGPN